MGAGRATHTHLRRSKSKRRRLRPNKSFKVLGREMTNENEANQVEPAHSLLLASLRFWEVERDLIDERKAATGR